MAGPGSLFRPGVVRAVLGRTGATRIFGTAAKGWVLVAASGLAVACGATHDVAAPPLRALALLPQLRVAESRAGPGYNEVHRRFRYLIVIGRPGTTSEAILRAEVALLSRDGWRLEPPRVVSNANQTTTVGLGHHGAEIVLRGPNDIYVALEYLNGAADLAQAAAPGGVGAPPALRREIRHGVPMLSAVLGRRE